MDKFLWAPDVDDKTAVVFELMKDGGVSELDARGLVEAFPAQPMDFFGKAPGVLEREREIYHVIHLILLTTKWYIVREKMTE